MVQQNPPRQSPPLNKKDSALASTPGSGGKISDALEAASKDLLRRVPPHSVEAEQAVLGGILLRNDNFHAIVDILTPNDFYLPAHALLYEACVELYRKNTPVDPLTLVEYLRANGLLERAGGMVYLAELGEAVVSAANVEYYAAIVRDRALQRSLISTCAEIIGNSFDSAREVESLLDESEQALFALTARKGSKQYFSSNDLVRNFLADLEKRYSEPDAVSGVTSGYFKLDQMTTGFQPSDLIILAARPSMGKTAFALNMCMRAAIQQNVPVAIYSLEMSKEQLIMRMLSVFAKVELSKLRRGNLDDDDWRNVHYAVEELSRAPIFIDDTPAISTLELRARTRRLKSQHGIGLVMVDYLQLMRSSRRVDSRELEISDISRSLKALAKELGIPVIALAQLNRKVEERQNKRPMLSDLRESGAIEQDADIIMFIYRDEAYNKRDDNPRKGVAEIIIGKQRNGPTGTVELAYVAGYTAFEDLTYTPPPPSEGYVDQ